MSSFRQKATAAITLVLLALFSASLSLAQERFGSIVGVVTDSTKAVVPGVAITITNKETGRSFSTVSNDEGKYFARDLEPGRYIIKAEMTGFNTGEMPDVLLLLGQERSRPISSCRSVGRQKPSSSIRMLL